MSLSRPSPVLEVLATPLAQLKSVGERRAPLFERLGLRTALDLLFFFPRDYQDLTELRTVSGLVEGELQSVVGKVVDIELRPLGPRRSLLGVLVEDDTGYVRCLWFNQPFMHKRFQEGQRVLVSGKTARKGGAWEISHPGVQWLDPDEHEINGKLLPVYSLTEGLSQYHVRKAVEEVVALGAESLDEALPGEFRGAKQLAPIREAIENIHFPADHEALAGARRRLVYQELFILQLALAIKRQQQQVLSRAPQFAMTAKIDARIRRLIPFELTTGQEAVIAEIVADLGHDIPMNRMLQGDVGSGKTIVAVYAMLFAIACGHQAVLMAPTEVLARQHAENFDRLLAASQVRRALVVGGKSTAERQQLRDLVAAGDVDLVIGTQALLRNEVEFKRLGIVVIDEQHKFGVRQRASLRQSGVDPHYLVMTATPIPRTIAMTLFGDLDVSTLRDAPPGRQPVRTYLAGPDKRAKWWDFFRKKLASGRQGYIVAPLVEGGNDSAEEQSAAGAEELFESLANGELADFRLGLVHGRMNPVERLATMEKFRAGEIQALVATTVIEVGVDVPNATLMTIEAGERFGLAQLHQLRGRVARGKFPGFCCVFANPQTDDSQKRLAAFVDTTDGFELAETDLALRGPGDLFGARQHGLPPLRIADLLRDADLLVEARRDALELVAGDPGLRRAEHARLRRMMLARYGNSLELGDVG